MPVIYYSADLYFSGPAAFKEDACDRFHRAVHDAASVLGDDMPGRSLQGCFSNVLIMQMWVEALRADARRADQVQGTLNKNLQVVFETDVSLVDRWADAVDCAPCDVKRPAPEKSAWTWKPERISGWHNE